MDCYVFAVMKPVKGGVNGRRIGGSVQLSLDKLVFGCCGGRLGGSSAAVLVVKFATSWNVFDIWADLS